MENLAAVVAWCSVHADAASLAALQPSASLSAPCCWLRALCPRPPTPLSRYDTSCQAGPSTGCTSRGACYCYSSNFRMTVEFQEQQKRSRAVEQFIEIVEFQSNRREVEQFNEKQTVLYRKVLNSGPSASNCTPYYTYRSTGNLELFYDFLSQNLDEPTRLQ